MSNEIDELLHRSAEPLRPSAAFEERLALKILEIMEESDAAFGGTDSVALQGDVAAEPERRRRLRSLVGAVALIAVAALVAGALIFGETDDRSPVITDPNVTTTSLPVDEGDTIAVVEGESIQDALDRAKSGDTVVVEAGVYEERLRIRTDGLTLEGRGAVLKAPSFPEGDCTFQGAGFGKQITISKPCTTEEPGARTYNDWPTARISGVTVSGFTIDGGAAGIAVLRGSEITVRDNEIRDTSGFGLFAHNSSSVRFENNAMANVASARESGIWVAGDSVEVVIAGNSIADARKGPGIFVLESREIEVSGNTVAGACGAGVSAVNALDVLISSNLFEANTVQCEWNFGMVNGVSVGGSDRVRIVGNTVSGQSHAALAAHGLWVGDTEEAVFEMSPAGSIEIVGNKFAENDIDVAISAGTATGSENECDPPSEAPLLCTG